MRDYDFQILYALIFDGWKVERSDDAKGLIWISKEGYGFIHNPANGHYELVSKILEYANRFEEEP